jgi:hypothetical protein
VSEVPIENHDFHKMRTDRLDLNLIPLFGPISSTRIVTVKRFKAQNYS